jgi:hypothetical protein
MALISITPIPDPPDNTGGGASKKAYDNVIFVPDDGGAQIVLKLEGPWKRSVGIKPDINKAVVSYKEMDKLKSSRNGKILFCYNKPGTADVTIEHETIIEIEAVDQRETPDKGVITAEYRLYFSDFREGYLEPRGGRLEFGPMNLGISPKWGSGSLQSIGVSDPNSKQKSTAPEVDMKTLIERCLDKMNITTEIPGGVSDYDAPRDLRWDGNHAPTELEKLLSMCGVAFVPGLDGKPTLETITTSGKPTLPSGEALPEQTIPSIDRRGASVIFSSYPRRSIETETASGPDPAAFYFVCRDKQGNWVKLEDCDLLKIGGRVDPAFCVRTNFEGVEEQYRSRLRSEVYRCIQAVQSPPAAVTPVLTRRLEKDLNWYEIQVTAKIALPNAKGIWSNSKDPVQVAVLMKTDEDVLVLGEAIVTVTGHTAYPTANFDKPADFKVRYSFESWEDDGDGGYKPVFSHTGFTAGPNGGFPQQMSDSEIENAIDGKTKDSIVLMRPEWWRAKVDGTEVNRSKIVAQAKSEAEIHLKNLTLPKRIFAARGFASVAPSGLITEVSWDQHELKTTVNTADSYAPLGALQENTELRNIEYRGKDEAFPKQGETYASKTEFGEAGAQQPCYITFPPVAQPAPPGVRLVKVIDVAKGGGFYYVLDTYGKAQQFGEDLLAGKDLNMPEGLKVPPNDQKKMAVHMPENGMNTHFLPLKSYQLALPLGNYTDKNGNATEVLSIVSNNCITVRILKPIEPYSLGNPTGSGGYYNGVSITGGPQSTPTTKLPDPTTQNLDIPESGEHEGKVTGHVGDLLVENVLTPISADP